MPGHKNKRLGLAKPPEPYGSGIPAGGAGKGDKSGIPARGYKWADHTSESLQGNEYGVTHGATSARFYGPVAEGLREQLFALPSCPGYLKDPLWSFALRGWAEAEAQCLLGQEYLSGLSVHEKYNAKKQGQTAPIEIVQKLEKHAANMRDKVGLSPVSAARLGKSLASTELDIARYAAGFGDQLMGDDGDED